MLTGGRGATTPKRGRGHALPVLLVTANYSNELESCPYVSWGTF